MKSTSFTHRGWEKSDGIKEMLDNAEKRKELHKKSCSFFFINDFWFILCDIRRNEDCVDDLFRECTSCQKKRWMGHGA